jgi:hypothetical protein
MFQNQTKTENQNDSQNLASSNTPRLPAGGLVPLGQVVITPTAAEALSPVDVQ